MPPATNIKRINACRFAEFYGLRLTEVAGVLGESYGILLKNPRCLEARPGLAKFLQAWNQMREVFADDIWIARWTHRPLPDDGRTPIEILLGEDGLIEFTGLVARIAAGAYRRSYGARRSRISSAPPKHGSLRRRPPFRGTLKTPRS